MQEIKKVSIFVDVQNIYYTTKQEFNLNFDYNKFWKLVTHNREVIGAFAYTINKFDKKNIVLWGFPFIVLITSFLILATKIKRGRSSKY